MKMKTVLNEIHLHLLKDEKGMGTIEIVILIAVLIGLAFLFRTFAVGFFTDITEGIKQNNQINTLFSNP